MKKNTIITLVILLLIIIAGGFMFWQYAKAPKIVTSFEECITAGNAVMESYPRQCRHDGQLFVEHIGNEIEKADLIKITSPRPNATISSPLTITGEARGNWFFEASFPVFLTDWDGKIIAQGIAQAQGEWMTTEFVPFEARLTFLVDKDIYSRKGTLILKKDNASGLPEHDDALEIPVMFSNEWQTYSDATQKVAFQYPKNLGTKYISTVEWPPKITVTAEVFSCAPANQVNINAKMYCVTKTSEGAAGSTYAEYVYKTLKDNKIMSLAFTLKFVQCANYPEPQATTCETEKTNTNIDTITAAIMNTVQFIQ